MFNEMKKRKYTQKKRAAQQQHTRQRIVEALVQLHEELGPAHTSISAIAERAGVERLTVYRHFPDEQAMYNACFTLYRERHPPPSTALWQDIDQPRQRTRKALTEIYSYFSTTRNMYRAAYRDLEDVPVLEGIMQQLESYLRAIADDLNHCWQPSVAKPALRDTLYHCVKFSTWQSLHEEKIKQHDIVDLVLSWIESVV